MLRIVCLLLIFHFGVSTYEAQGQLIQRLRARRAAGQTPLIERALNLAQRLQGHEDLAPNKTPEPTPAEDNQNQQANNVAQRRGAGDLRPPQPEPLQVPIASLDNAGLQREIVRSHDNLQRDLARFSSAKSWQGFLAVPERLGDSGEVNPQVLDSLVNRYERVAGNDKFSQVSSLASFDRTRDLIAELSSRLENNTGAEETGGPLLGDPSGTSIEDTTVATASFDEEPNAQPAPPARIETQATPQPVLSSKTGERSILVRRN